MRFTRSYCGEYLRQRKLGYRPGAHIMLDGCNDRYSGSMLLADEGRYEFSETPCFAAWNDTFVDEEGQFISRYDEDCYESHELEDDHLEVTYEHKVDRIRWEDTEFELVYRAGWDNVIQPVYKLMPTFDELMKGNELVFDTTKFSLVEVNHNWRVVRCFNEHSQLVRSAAWAAHLYPEMSPPEQLVLAAVHELGPYGYMKRHCGEPHSSLIVPMDFGAIARSLRSFNYMYANGGVLWGPDHADPTSRHFMGIDDEVQIADNRPVTDGDAPLDSNYSCGPGTIPGDDYDKELCWDSTIKTAAYIQDLQQLCDAAELTASVDVASTLAPYRDVIRRNNNPW